MIFTRSKTFLCKTEATVLLKWEEGGEQVRNPVTNVCRMFWNMEYH